MFDASPGPPSIRPALTWLPQFILIAPMLLFSLVAHEYAHGWAALQQGDPTARDLGRLTWDPRKHIDPFMTILMPLMLASMNAPIIGGAKPIPVVPGNFRDLRRGDIIVSLAGVTANLLIALACIPFAVLAGWLGTLMPALVVPLALLQHMAIMGIFLNMILVVFNLMPIPPLDGSHVVKYLLPPSLANLYQRVGGAGILILIALLYFVPGFRTVILGPALFVQAFAQQFYLPFLLPSPFP